MNTNFKVKQVNQASYLIYDGSPTIKSPITLLSDRIDPNSKTVTFYTYDGEKLETINHNFDFQLMNSMLDQDAPCPKPKSYRRIWLPNLSVKLNYLESVLAEPGYAVLFHDKNGNRIAWEVLNEPDEHIIFWEEYNLSEVIEEPADFSLRNDISTLDGSSLFMDNIHNSSNGFRRSHCDWIAQANDGNMLHVSIDDIDENHNTESKSTCILF